MSATAKSLLVIAAFNVVMVVVLATVSGAVSGALVALWVLGNIALFTMWAVGGGRGVPR